MKPNYNFFFFGHTSSHIWKTNSTSKGRAFIELSKLLPGHREKWQPLGLVPSLSSGSFCNKSVSSISDETAMQCSLLFSYLSIQSSWKMSQRVTHHICMKLWKK